MKQGAPNAYLYTKAADKLENLSELALLELWILTKILQQLEKHLGFPIAQLVKNPPAMQGTWVRSLGWEDLLEKG